MSLPLPVVFDLDGTLIDSAPDIAAVANRVLVAEGLETLSLPTVTSFVGNGVGVLVARIAAARGVPPDSPQARRMLEAFLAQYEGAHDLTRLYDGVPAMLTALATRGHAMALCTNKPEAPARSLLAHFGLAHHFGVVVGGDSLTVRKPDPAMLHETLARMAADRAVFVGDSEIDAETAAAAGIPFLLFTEGYRKTPVESISHAAAFARFDDLPDLIADL